MAVHCVKNNLGKLILINLCRPALEVRFFLWNTVYTPSILYQHQKRHYFQNCFVKVKLQHYNWNFWN